MLFSLLVTSSLILQYAQTVPLLLLSYLSSQLHLAWHHFQLLHPQLLYGHALVAVVVVAVERVRYK
jgi:hypothetical protein